LLFFQLSGVVYDRAMDGGTAFVLAGGQSSRMGADKAFVQLDGRTLLERALELAAAVAPEVCIVGSQHKFGMLGRVIEDLFPDHGPLGGIHAALRASSTDCNLILAVDMPFVEARFLGYLLEQARRTNAMVTVPRAGGGWQPLCAAYRRPFSAVAESALRAGRNKIDPLFVQVEMRVVEEQELLEHNFAVEMFRNLNTPEELKEAQH
jgi:molybdopterin-guanine dinucleotide biosynthesis protein A